MTWTGGPDLGRDALVGLLKRLVAIPSVSRGEAQIARFVGQWLERRGLAPVQWNRNVYCQAGRGSPSLLINAHTDTVPPVGWNSDPYHPRIDGGKLYGLGASDTKSSLAAMMHAFAEVSKRDLKGTLIFSATCMEEVGREGLEALLPKLPKFDAAVIGEPTDLDLGIAQRGMARVSARARGCGGHAALAIENCIHLAAADIARIDSIGFENRHPLLGFPGLQVTQIQAGETPNVVPPECRFVIDIRSTPCHPNLEVVGRLRSALKSELTVEASRLEARETSVFEPVVQAALRALPGSKPVGMAFTTEMAIVPAPTVVVGPGDPAVCHRPDENVDLDKLALAAEAYVKIFLNFLT